VTAPSIVSPSIIATCAKTCIPFQGIADCC